MRSPLLSLLALLALVSLALAWSKEDHEIFRLRDEVIEHEGADATFYSFLDVSPSATFDEVEKANRKRSRQLHPDKAVASILANRSKPDASKKSAPGVKVKKGPSSKERAKVTREATARYQRLSVVANILKSESRARYDHFLRNGFPRWRGTGYYYARFRPGLGAVLVGLFIVFGGFIHYGALYVGWKRHKDFVHRYVTQARKMAWGNESGMPGVPALDANSQGFGQAVAPPAAAAEEAPEEEQGLALNRRQKRAQEKASKKKDAAKPSKYAKTAGISKPVEAAPIEGPQGSKKKVVAENGKVLIVDSLGNVFLEETTEEGQPHEYLLDVSCLCLSCDRSSLTRSTQPNDIAMPSIFQTAVFRLPVWAYSNTLGRLIHPGPVNEPLLDGGEGLTLSDQDDVSRELIDAAVPANPKAETRRRKAKTVKSRS